MEGAGPAGGALGAGEHQHLVLEALAVQLVARLDDRAFHGIDAAPARDRVVRDERLAFGNAADDLATVKNEVLGSHGGTPFQRPVSAASMQSRVEPNHA